MTDHPDLEALSAAVDGDDPASAVAFHVKTCGDCRARLDGMRRARAAVAAPVAPLGAEARERMLAAALRGEDAAAAPSSGPGRGPAAGPGTSAPRPAPVPPLPVREREREREPRRWWLAAGGAAAAVLAVVVGTAGLLNRDSGGGTDTALSRGPAPGAAESDASASGAAGDVADVGDLGNVADVEALRARLPVSTATARTGSQGGATGLAASPPAPTAAAAPAPEAAVLRQTGTRPCEEQARTARPQVGTVVYQATARFAGTPAVVLGFAATPGSPPVTVLVLAESGCRLLGETVAP